MSQQQIPNNNNPVVDICCSSNDDSNKVSYALRWLYEAIDYIPLEKKLGFLTAQQRCPGVVLLESNPLIFLRYDNFDVWAAAERLVKYWEWRVILFEERAYMPILDINTHANTEFLLILKDDAVVILPGTDPENDMIVYFEKSRFRFVPFEQMEAHQFIRVVFYTWTKILNSYASRTHQSQRCKVIFLNLIFKVPAVAHLRNDLRDIMMHAMPVEFKKIHMLFLPNFTGWSRLIKYVMPIVLQMINFHFSGITKTIVPHVSFYEGDLADQLQSDFGLSKEILPTSIGGLLSLDYCVKGAWIKQETEQQEMISNQGGDSTSYHSADGCLLQMLQQQQVTAIPCSGNTAAAATLNVSTSNTTNATIVTTNCYYGDSQVTLQEGNQVFNFSSLTDPLAGCNKLSVNRNTEICDQPYHQQQHHISFQQNEQDQISFNYDSASYFSNNGNHDHSILVTPDVLECSHLEFNFDGNNDDSKHFFFSDVDDDLGSNLSALDDSVTSFMIYDNEDNVQLAEQEIGCSREEEDKTEGKALENSEQSSANMKQSLLRKWVGRFNHTNVENLEQKFNSYWKIRTQLFSRNIVTTDADNDHEGLPFGIQEDIGTSCTNFVFLVRCKKKKGAYLLILDPAKIVGHSFESQRRCLFNMLDQLLETALKSTEELELELSVLLFMDNNGNDDVVAKEEPHEDTGTVTNNFGDIIESFPIRLVWVHVIMEQWGMGWFAYQERAKTKAKKLIDVSEESMQIHAMNREDKSISTLLLDHGFSRSQIKAIIGGRLADNEQEYSLNQQFANNEQSFPSSSVSSSLYDNEITELRKMVPLGQKITTPTQQLLVVDYWRRKIQGIPEGPS